MSDNQKLIRRGVNEDKTIVHSDYEHNGKHNAPRFDIGLIRLDEPVSNIVPICLPWRTEGFQSEGYSEVTVTGWGRTTVDDEEHIKNFQAEKVGSSSLLQITLNVIRTAEDCKPFEYDIDTDTQLCAGDDHGKSLTQVFVFDFTL